MLNFLYQALSADSNLDYEIMALYLALALFVIFIVVIIVMFIRVMVKNYNYGKSLEKNIQTIEYGKDRIRQGDTRDEVRRYFPGITRYSNFKQDLFVVVFGETLVVLKVIYSDDVVVDVSYSSHIVDYSYH